MLKLTFFTLTLNLAFITAVAQKHTYIGFEGAADNDVYDIIDNGSILKKVPLITGYFVLTFDKILVQLFFWNQDY